MVAINKHPLPQTALPEFSRQSGRSVLDPAAQGSLSCHIPGRYWFGQVPPPSFTSAGLWPLNFSRRHNAFLCPQMCKQAVRVATVPKPNAPHPPPPPEHSYIQRHCPHISQSASCAACAHTHAHAPTPGDKTSVRFYTGHFYLGRPAPPPRYSECPPLDRSCDWPMGIGNLLRSGQSFLGTKL